MFLCVALSGNDNIFCNRFILFYIEWNVKRKTIFTFYFFLLQSVFLSSNIKYFCEIISMTNQRYILNLRQVPQLIFHIIFFFVIWLFNCSTLLFLSVFVTCLLSSAVLVSCLFLHFIFHSVKENSYYLYFRNDVCNIVCIFTSTQQNCDLKPT